MRPDRAALALAGLLAAAHAPGPPGAGGAAAAEAARAEAEERYRGEAPDDNFGFALAGSGDFDGDGRPDLIVGAIFNDDAGSAAGKAYVFPGARVFGLPPIVAMTGEAPDDQFGVSVAGAGDVNGDGFSDVIVGARFNDRAASAAGAAFVFFGGRPADGRADLVLTGEFKDDWFGQSVAGAGDVNADGFADLIVGAPFNDDRGSAAGKAYLYLGGPRPSAAPAAVLYGDSQADGHFGWSVSGAGDVNGDGFGDVVVGARLFGSGLDRARGRAYVFFGGAAVDGVPDLVLTGEFKDDWFGHAVGGAGDVNGDGYGDILVGAPFYDVLDGSSFLSAAGRIYVFLGGAAPDAVPDHAVTGTQMDEQLGWSLDGGADADGDGLDDLVGGARFYDEGTVSAAGRLVVAFGARGTALRGGPRIAGLQADDQFGHDVALLGPATAAAPGDLASGAVYSDVAGGGAGGASRLSLRCLFVSAATDAVTVAGCRDFERLDVYRGRVGDLGAGDAGTCAGTLRPPAEVLTDPATPAPGEAFFYLATGDAAGLGGHPGFRSDGRPRPAPAPCP
jgi:hypothetical protein